MLIFGQNITNFVSLPWNLDNSDSPNSQHFIEITKVQFNLGFSVSGNPQLHKMCVFSQNSSNYGRPKQDQLISHIFFTARPLSELPEFYWDNKREI